MRPIRLRSSLRRMHTRIAHAPRVMRKLMTTSASAVTLTDQELTLLLGPSHPLVEHLIKNDNAER